ncbi:phosphohydrolase [Brumimicrobium salinarum]|uniref:Phosphohydrolase n=1 Tax=Brumimicrobium salinarum TaxID=2058658 RepID=A0A2I0R0T6_9FLAO|nr:HD domain-containing protein [Brumimicrobium salinarum]PKR80000.1 phosphohydrolase [Brumimicrobium salinarum]
MRPNLNINNKKKIINDPVYGFISLPKDIIFDLIEHPFYQRLRRIKQLGMSHLVYPGALHTRFHHALGATHLMTKAIQALRYKGIPITEEEETAVLIAILLHDIGHGPFSHTLEHDIVSGVSHEEISLLFMRRLSIEFDGKLDLAIQIFEDKYKKSFLHQLVSSQLDMDRMDYLNRDSFYTGVSEGVIGSDRIIAMLDVVDNQLVVEQKGVYSIEKFLVARRLMYWQVYMHKTVVSSEVMLTFILKRAKYLTQSGTELFASPAFKMFLAQEPSLSDFQDNADLLHQFALLDDFDIMGAVKVWQFSEDKVLSLLATQLINRKLFKIEIATQRFSDKRIQYELDLVQKNFNLSEEEAQFFVHTDALRNNAYNEKKENINLLMKDGSVKDVSQAADNLNIHALSEPVEKYFLCYPSHFVT